MADEMNGNNLNPSEYYKNATVASEYDRIRFSSLAGRVFNGREKYIIKQCFKDCPRDTIILDLPCGTGRLADALLASGLRVHGADVSAEMLAVAAARLSGYGERFSTEVIDAFAPTGAEPRFDAALCARVLMHFPLETQIKFLRGVVSNTRNTIVLNHCLNSPYQRFRRWVKKLLNHQQPARYPISNNEIKRLLAESGLTEVKRYRMNPLISEAVYVVAKRIN